MGLLSNLKKAFSERSQNNEFRKFAAKKEREQREEYAQAIENSRREWEILERAKKRPFYDQPNYDLDNYPFGNRPYVTRAEMALNRESGEVYEDSRIYYADSDAKSSVASDLRRIERMLNGDNLGVPGLPALKTNTARIKANLHGLSLLFFLLYLRRQLLFSQR